MRRVISAKIVTPKEYLEECIVKPEPLKGKSWKCVCGLTVEVHDDYDLKSAVDWLKHKLRFAGDIACADDVDTYIDEAFEDVMK